MREYCVNVTERASEEVTVAYNTRFALALEKSSGYSSTRLFLQPKQRASLTGTSERERDLPHSEVAVILCYHLYLILLNVIFY